MLSQQFIKELFDYGEGFLIYKIKPKYSRIVIGGKAGSVFESKGEFRRAIKIKGKSYYSSRLIFLWHKGFLPDLVDHRDRNTMNDKIENLREADRLKNSKNRKSATDSASKYLGVSRMGRKWRARISVNGKMRHLGVFESEEQAALIYNDSAIIYHKEFANLNKLDIL